MAKEIEVVIKVSEEVYNKIREGGFWLESGLQLSDAYDAIKNGILLPKGHGRIVDVGKIDEDRIDHDNPIIYLTINGEYIEAVSLDYLNSLQTIIEADKSNEERDGKIQEVKVYEERIPSYEAGYNDAKREIALSGEYERAYERGKADAQTEKWISVTERLPKIADVYRVTRYYPKNVMMNPNYYVDACFFDGSNWYNDNRINHERAYASNIIAWQENPEPYEPQKRSDME